MHRYALIGLGVMLLSAAPGAARAQETRYEFAQLHMGMEVRVVLYAGDSVSAEGAASAAFARIEKLEDIMSDYRDGSEVRRLTGRAGEWVRVSPELFAVFTSALEVARRSGGAFDPTVGPLVQLWRKARETGAAPEDQAVRRAKLVVGVGRIALESASQSVRLDTAGMMLDLGGIAKGYILDQAMEQLRALGTRKALIVAGGDIVAGDAPPGMAGWRIEVRGSPKVAERARALVNASLSTSGSTEQFVIIDGVRYSHVIDPRSGWPLTSSALAYVVMKDGALADALATALTVVDAAEAADLMAGYPDAVWDVVR